MPVDSSFSFACAQKEAETADPVTLKGTIRDDVEGTFSLDTLQVLLRLASGPTLDKSVDVACVQLATTVVTLQRHLEVVERQRGLSVSSTCLVCNLILSAK